MPSVPKDESYLLFRTRCGVRRAPLQDFLSQLAARVTKRGAITCMITGDSEVRRLNRQFRGKNYTTDILSFPSAGRSECAGDLAISLPRAKAQAREHGHSLTAELRILMLHGALHLAGLDHENDDGRMARSEARWRKTFELPHGLIERAGQ